MCSGNSRDRKGCSEGRIEEFPSRCHEELNKAALVPLVPNHSLSYHES